MKYNSDDEQLERLSNDLLDKQAAKKQKRFAEKQKQAASKHPAAIRLTDEKITAADIALAGGKLTVKGFAAVSGTKRARQLRAIGIAIDEYYEGKKKFWRRQTIDQIKEDIDNDDRRAARRRAGTDIEFLDVAASYDGRRPGEQINRPLDYSDIERVLFDDLAAEVQLLRRFWRRQGIKVVAPTLTARGIVVRRVAKVLKIENLERKLEIWDKRDKTGGRRQKYLAKRRSKIPVSSS